MACYWAWERCKLPQWSPPAAKGFDAFCLDLQFRFMKGKGTTDAIFMA